MRRLPKHSTLWLAAQLFRLWCRGYQQVPGYTVAERTLEGNIYFAVELRSPHHDL
jgi:hypothetical protein